MSANQTQKVHFSIDLHCHSTCSDGALSPELLVERAVEQGVKTLSITDHDSIAAIAPARAHIKANALELEIINGIELSSQWEGQEIHVLGYRMDIENKEFSEFLSQQANTRWERAKRISEQFEKKNINSMFELASDLSLGHPPGRVHFAQALLNRGIVKTRNQAFRDFLGAGKSCYVKPLWPETRAVIKAIQNAGGTAYLAHPYGYQLSKSQMRRLMKSFAEFGGDGMEVVSGTQTPTQSEFLVNKAKEHNLQISVGSDFHGPTQWSELGRIAVPTNIEEELRENWSQK